MPTPRQLVAMDIYPNAGYCYRCAKISFTKEQAIGRKKDGFRRYRCKHQRGVYHLTSQKGHRKWGK